MCILPRKEEKKRAENKAICPIRSDGLPALLNGLGSWSSITIMICVYHADEIDPNRVRMKVRKIRHLIKIFLLDMRITRYSLEI